MKRMRMFLTAHARRQLALRNITSTEIHRALLVPVAVIQQSETRFRALATVYRAGKAYLLVIVYDQTKSRREIITAFITSKTQKYGTSLR